MDDFIVGRKAIIDFLRVPLDLSPTAKTAWNKILRWRRNQGMEELFHRDITGEELKSLFARQRGKCVVCKRSIKKEFHIDHIVPVSRGGDNYIQNIQLLCPSCNLSKHSKDSVCFMQSRGFLC
jgi:5-methylcytosine-specific restriction endonuclease McrA